MSSAETNHVTVAPTATIEEDFQYLDDVSETGFTEESDQGLGEILPMAAEPASLVRVATCGSGISHIRADPRYVLSVSITRHTKISC